VFIGIWWVSGAARVPPRFRIVIAASAALALGAGDEVFQRLFPDRSVELADFAADLCGVAAGAAMVLDRDKPRARLVIFAVSALGAGLLANHSHHLLKDYYAGLLDEEQGRYASARAHYLRAIASGSAPAGVFNELAWLNLEQQVGSAEETVEYARRGATLEPHNADVLDTYGWALDRAGKSREALPILEHAYKLKPTTAGVHYHLGMTLLSLGNREAAERHLNAQIASAPQSGSARRAAEALASLTATQ
jgi:tetratricopeptide (TPR) repeat protein